jgi:exodeoxyribonuclease V gamma subunit
VQAFASLLALPLSRWTANDVLGIAAVPAVMRRFDLDEADLDRLRHWIEQAGVRWGLDASTRAAAGAGHWPQNTWRYGLDRLLLGVPLADPRCLVDGVAPYSDLEGGGTAALGRIWGLVESLAAWAARLVEPATAGDWRDRLNAMLESLLRADTADAAESQALDTIHEAIGALEGAEACIPESAISWPAVREVLNGALSRSGERQPFLAGGVSFCGLMPLRAVPFRVIALLGLNDGQFPRQDAHRSLNLVRLFPRVGDRSRRDDDRLLFLQSIIAARDTLYLSFTGQDVRSGEGLPPSPVVGELLDFLHRYHFPELDAAALRRQLITRQPMQPFSARYLAEPDGGADRVFTYNVRWRAGTVAAHGPRQPMPVFADGSAVPEMPDDVIDLADLRSFFDHPARQFYTQVLQLAFDRGATRALSDAEPIALDTLAASRLRQTLFDEARIHGALPDRPDALLSARGVLPPAPLDVAAYEPLAADVNALLPIWQDWCAARTPEARSVDLVLASGARLVGLVGDVWPDGLRRVRVGPLGLRHRISGWIDHLALRAARHDGMLRMAGTDGEGGGKSGDARRRSGTAARPPARHQGPAGHPGPAHHVGLTDFQGSRAGR